MNVLVTGGAGFIGSHIVDQLIGAGHKLSIVDSLVSGRRELAHREASLRVMDIRDPQLDAFVESIHPEVVVHAAAQVSVSRSVADPMADASVNVLGTLALLEHCRRARVRRVVYISKRIARSARKRSSRIRASASPTATPTSFRRRRHIPRVPRRRTGSQK